VSNGAFSPNGNGNITIPASASLPYYFTSWKHSGNGTVTVTAPATIYVKGDFTMTGNGTLKIVSSGSNVVKFIVGGDFNTSLAMNGTRWFRKHLVDTYSARHCDGRRATWSLAGVLSWRIDYVFVSPELAPSSYCIAPQPTISDHSAVVTTLAYDAPARVGALP
jgi:hypothetical protein